MARFPSWSTSSQFLKMCCTKTTCILTSLSSKGNLYGVLTPSGNPCSQSRLFLIQSQQFSQRSLRPSPQPPIPLPWFRSTLYLHLTSDLHQATNSKLSHLVCCSPPHYSHVAPSSFLKNKCENLLMILNSPKSKTIFPLISILVIYQIIIYVSLCSKYVSTYNEPCCLPQ